jgi:hypothetical protein
MKVQIQIGGDCDRNSQGWLLPKPKLPAPQIFRFASYLN